MDMLYLWPSITILVVVLLLIKNKKSLNKNKIIEICLLSVLLIMVGLGSIWAFMGHAFMSAQMAAYIGWPAGNPFQLEVAFTNLAFGILGLLCWKIRDNFWTATIIGITVFYWGAAYIHAMEIINKSNYAPGNSGIPVYVDILIPLILIVLLIAYKKTMDKSGETT